MKRVLLLILVLVTFPSMSNDEIKFIKKDNNPSNKGHAKKLIESGVCDTVITYKDNNDDGRIDEKYHDIPCASHSDYVYLDSNYDGTYDTEIVYAFAILKRKINIPVVE